MSNTILHAAFAEKYPNREAQAASIDEQIAATERAIAEHRARHGHPRVIEFPDMPTMGQFFQQASDTYHARRELGTVPARCLPCPSDANTGAHDADNTRTDMLVCIEEAIGKLEEARILLEQGKPSCELAARSLMNEAIDWASESEA